MPASLTSLRTVRRYQLELELDGRRCPGDDLPPGYLWTPWRPEHLTAHAAVLFESFRGHPDCRLIRCLGSLEGCGELMTAIATHPQFAPEATWLICRRNGPFAPPIPCGSVQALTSASGCGRFQNIGLLPEDRRQGLGRALIWKSLRGLMRLGMHRVRLDVTAGNAPALSLYRGLGFRRTLVLFSQPHEAQDKSLALPAG